MRHQIRHRMSWSHNSPQLVIEREDNGNWQSIEAANAVIEYFPISIFSQGQIAALAGSNQQALLDLIDTAADVTKAKAVFEEEKKSYLSYRAKARELDARLQGRELAKLELDEVQKKIQAFEQSNHATILNSYQRRSNQEADLKNRFESVRQVVSDLRKVGAGIQFPNAPDGLYDDSDSADVAATSLIDELRDTVDNAKKKLEELATELQKALESNQSRIEQSTWQHERNATADSYTQLAERLESEGVSDVSEYSGLVQSKAELEERERHYASLEREKKEALANADKQMEAVVSARRAISERRNSFLESVLADNKYVRIRLVPYQLDPTAMEREVRELLLGDGSDGRFAADIGQEGGKEENIVSILLRSAGRGTTDHNSEMEGRISKIKEHLVSACGGEDVFGGHLNNYLAKEFENRPEYVDRIRTWFPGDGLDIKYSQKSDGKEFKPIDQASAGQRAAAMLAFLLAHGDAPIVLDQPEDDLDNELIYRLVVSQIRENKPRRQIIVVTHNPNIVVNGDAEMLHAMNFAKGQCRVIERGALQRQVVRDRVCDIMEGGQDAFDRRYRRLGHRS